MKKDILESNEFVSLMQAYRHGNRTDQKKIANAFEAIKKFLRENKEEIFENCNCVHMTGRTEDGSQNCILNIHKHKSCIWTTIGAVRNCERYSKT
jgi:hypothetical protein